VRASVQRQTTGQQVPWESSSLVGNFYFAPSTVAEAIATDKSNTIDPVAFELSYWDTIKTSANAEDFKAYLEKYPNGQFAELARNKIKSLEGAAKPSEPSRTSSVPDSATEMAFWDYIKNSTNVEDFKAYLKKYPNGTFADLAANRVAALEAVNREKEKAEAAKRLEAEAAMK
jgi:TolA-binding protein